MLGHVGEIDPQQLAALKSKGYRSGDEIGQTGVEANYDNYVRGIDGIATLRVDGGASANDFLMQFQADILGTTVDRPKVVETTATGAAFLAGLGVSFWTQDELERVRAVDKVFNPKMKPADRESAYAGWKDAVARVRSGRA